ncbi:MAG: hypothetical protein EXQ56_01185 [Acidobacteria bacterium]|nr:hypothetical protein [Acidobacteriota bacterium]
MNATTPNAPYTADQRTLLRDLFAAGCVLIGDEVERRVGLRSPIYINMRENLYAHPEVLWRIGGAFAGKIRERAKDSASAARVSKRADGELTLTPGDAGSPAPQPIPQIVIGIPDTATPLALATALHAWQNPAAPEITFALLRKEAKRYPGHEESFWIGPHQAKPDPSRATERHIDGVQGAPTRPAATIPGASESAPVDAPAGGDSCVEREYNLIDDVVASGLTKRAAAAKLRAEGVPLTRIIVFFDRGQGDGLREEGFDLHSIFQLKDVVDFYHAEALITAADHQRIQQFLSTRRFDVANR